MDTLAYFHLNEQPFRLGPDPRYLFFSDQVKEAIAKCEYMAQERIGPIYLYGPIGSGKTSILRRLYDRLSQDSHYRVALVISPNVKTANAFLRVILESFEVKTERSYDQTLKNFERFLVELYQQGIVPLLFVDEAQNLNRDTLRLVHYLLNFETATTKLLQVVLAGQEELATKVLRYRELASRMFPVAINAMSPTDLQEMIAFRWMVAGGKVPPFDAAGGAYKTLFSYSKGLPRDAIKVCDEVLRELLVTGKYRANAAEIDKIAREINLASTESRSER
jgi:general secretion pathway protein A